MMWHVCMLTKLSKGVVMTGDRAHSALSISRPELMAFFVDILVRWWWLVVKGQ